MIFYFTMFDACRQQRSEDFGVTEFENSVFENSGCSAHVCAPSLTTDSAQSPPRTRLAARTEVAAAATEHKTLNPRAAAPARVASPLVDFEALSKAARATLNVHVIAETRALFGHSAP
jgi:hypothetical protein